MGMGRKGNHFTLHGQLHEPLALKEYKKATGCRVGQYGLVASKEKPWLACSPDGVTHCGRLVEVRRVGRVEGQGDGTLTPPQLKCPVSRLIVPGEVPRHYLPQLQISMYILDLQEADYFEWTQGQTNLVRVKRDQPYIDAMLEKLQDFYDQWQTMKQEGRKPKRRRAQKKDFDFL